MVVLFIKEEELLVSGEVYYDYIVFDTMYKAEKHLIEEYEKLRNFELIKLTDTAISVNVNCEKIIRMKLEAKMVK